MSGSDHLTETEYGNFRAALEDADRVARDLLWKLDEGQAMLVPAAEVEFLARRIHVLLSACLVAEEESRAAPPPPLEGGRP